MNSCRYLEDGNCVVIKGKTVLCIGAGCIHREQVSVTMNDGGSADYYKLPVGATDLQDIIEAKDMNFAIGNIMKSVYRLNDNTHSDSTRDLRKIIWFAERELERSKEAL